MNAVRRSGPPAFEVPEFPRLGGAQDDVATLPPAALGQHTLQVLRDAGVSAAECEAMVAAGAVCADNPESFAWAPVRQES